jgi:hypothetical protein
VRRALVAALVLLCACSSRTAAPPARISGVNDIALVDNLLFITSTDRNELRALDLGEPEFIVNLVARDFVRAPNPLEPLSIPVLDRPVGIARDVRWKDIPSLGTEETIEISGVPALRA